MCVLLFREKFIRLQHENKMLRVQQEEYEREKIASLQAQLEEAHKTRSELDTENRFLSSTDRCDGSCSLHTFSLMCFHHLSNVLDLDVNLSFLYILVNLQIEPRTGR